MRPAALCVALVVLLAGCTGNDKQPAAPTAAPGTPEAAMEALIAFARTQSDVTWANVPFATSVDLGLADTLYVRRRARQLREPAAWRLAVEPFRGRTGTYSALELIASEHGRLQVTQGPHRHCASPPVPAPAQMSTHRQVAVQPRDADGCLDWWTVDAFVDDEGKIRAVTLDLWEP